MKHHVLFITVLSVILICYGCSSGGGSSRGIGFIPSIKAVQTYNVNDLDSPVGATSFKVGDQLSFWVKAEDDDDNMKTLLVTAYQSSSTLPFNGPYSFSLPKQTSQVMEYFPIGIITFSSSVWTAGNYRFDLQIEDARGNLTDVYSVNISLE